MKRRSQLEILLPTAVDHGFDYAAPPELTLASGAIVAVPFGRKESLGVVWGEGKAKLEEGKLKSIIAASEFPPLSESMREFINWAAWYNCAPVGMMLKMALPLKIQDSGFSIQGKRKQKIVSANPESRILNPESSFALAELSETQSAAAAALAERIGKGFSVTLLDGVTGSGKTEVYFDAIARILGKRQEAGGRSEEESLLPLASSLLPQILVLLPEIALSVQWLSRFEKRFGFAPVVWHSEVTPAKKRASWQAIAKGEARVVVGARSALFLPYRNLQLIVVDEEHDQSYKQEDGVIYHARDMAVSRARFEKLPAVLVSATPSLETYQNAKQGKYHEVSLAGRHNDAHMPDVALLDMRREPLARGAFIADSLRQKLSESLAAGHQSMLFLNRRGYAPLVLCRHCGHRFECPECSAWMVMHTGKRPEAKGQSELTLASRLMPHASLRCHHCNHREPLPKTCPACGAADEMQPCGPGVERVLEEVKAFLPEARVAVMASDQLGEQQDAKQIISDMERKEIDILIGTQMIAKGHHFAGLALVGVVDADLGLAGGDLRAAERTYQLLHQLSGRAGREQVRGKVYLQSYLPEHPVMAALLSGDRDAFLAAELAAREEAHMPPFSRLAALIVEGAKEDAVIQTAKALASGFSVIRHPSSVIQLLGPAPAPLYRLRGHFRMRLLVKAGRNVNVPDFVKSWVESVDAPSSVRIKIDIDPVSFL